MSTEILVFNPLETTEVQDTQSKLDKLLCQDWKIVSALSGNRVGASPTKGFGDVVRASDSQRMPEYKDYVVLILHKPDPSESGTITVGVAPKGLQDSFRR